MKMPKQNMKISRKFLGTGLLHVSAKEKSLILITIVYILFLKKGKILTIYYWMLGKMFVHLSSGLGLTHKLV